MPFATGPRNCLGQPLAHIILRIMLAKIMKSCKVEDARLNASQNLQYCTDKENEETYNEFKERHASWFYCNTTWWSNIAFY